MHFYRYYCGHNIVAVKGKQKESEAPCLRQVFLLHLFMFESNSIENGKSV